MRKVMVLVVASLLMSVVFASTAYAYQSREVVFYGNAQSGSVSYGDHGYSWYHSDTYDENDAAVLGDWRYYRDNEGNKHYYYKQNSRHTGWGTDRQYNRVSDRDGEWNYYVDDNGVRHYFYLDPDREYEVHSYKDKNGTIQYAFVKAGWK